MNAEGTDLRDLPLATMLTRLEASEEGLTSSQAMERLARFGANEVVEEQHSLLRTLLGYFWGPIPWMIEVALVLSLLVRHWSDAVVIGLLLAMNGMVAFLEERQAANAIASLKERMARTARVRRDGSWQELAVAQVVPGDLARLRLGDIVPADARLLDGSELTVDQSALTGESLPVTRERGDAVYSGAVVTRGEADAVVYATGTNSFFGRTTELVGSAGTVSHFQQAVLRIGHYLIALALAIVGVTVVVSVARGHSVLSVLEFALVLTIASVPVALPAVLSVTMAVGARSLARHHAVVSHLPAVEELGGMDVLCADKTGTLTQNRLAVTQEWIAPGANREELYEAAALASRAEDGDPIDLAVLAATSEQPRIPVRDFVPFDPVTKRTEARADGRTVTKGAPQVIAQLCDADVHAADVQRVVDDFAGRGFRSLGVAETRPPGSWRMLGVLALADPPREDSAATIRAARDLGVAVKVVTGDQAAIAKEVAREVGLSDDILPAGALDAADPLQGAEDPRAEATVDDALAATVESADGFAEVFPEHKYRIVRALQSRGHIVGMTGDGVNDAPALKQADAGIAVSGATDAARAAADVVLLAPGLSVIVEAIREAREIFARMTSYATYRIAETIRVLLVIALAILVAGYFPVTAGMIVLLAVLNDGAILAIAYDRARGSAVPTSWDMRRVLTVATAIGLMGVAETFLLFGIAHVGFDLGQDTIRTLIYLKLSVSGHLTIFVTRSRSPFWSPPAPAPILLGAVLGTQAIATLIAVFGVAMAPLGWGWAAVVWVYALVWFLVEDRVKVVTNRVLDARQAP